jgi:integrative and conjugative element protein (TIGR02256 family)
MQYMNYWRSPDGGPCLVIQDGVLEVFEKYVQNNFFSLEAGGILLGYVREPHLEILEASEPTRWDKRLRCFFDRSAQGHHEVAQRASAESRGLVRYIGEWHTHPEDYPTPSTVDRYGWVNLAKKRQDQRPVLAIIVGRMALHVELVGREGQSVILQSSLE